MEAVTIASPLVNQERLTPKDLIRKHIADPTHKVTEEEFEKLIVGVFNSPMLREQQRNQ